MADAEALPEEGLALWLTEWKVRPRIPWLGRHLVASVGSSVAGQIDFFLHPGGQAVKVVMLRVHPDFQRRGLAGVLMDALYAAHPTAWINHGLRTKNGAQWCDLPCLLARRVADVPGEGPGCSRSWPLLVKVVGQDEDTPMTLSKVRPVTILGSGEATAAAVLAVRLSGQGGVAKTGDAEHGVTYAASLETAVARISQPFIRGL